ncbi:MAG: efflux RND transporter permease subunit [Pyrinomonadaceae bacterium]|nr:efflux RND transporter permease subunit [Acidobacteriota bacterium]MBP7474244.1 efflux RND transporter permease subunit [Pyrinomonadaceae bacterium]MBP9109561.1 efflux RND transporter permease subunit [Pyrinomonadaceae bacterium]
MINAIIRFSITQKLVVMLLVAIMAAAGAYSLINLPIDAVPDVTNVQVQVLTSAPSLAPLEIERQITFPIEVSMSGIPNVEEIRSVSKFGISNVTIVFEETTDIYFARQLVLERLSQAREQIPSNIGSPEMGPIATGLGEIYQYEVKAEKGSNYTATDLRTIHDWNIRRQLMGVPGVTEVNSHGGFGKQYEVRLIPEKLLAYDLRLRDVYEAVTRNNGTVGGGYIEKGAEQYLLRGVGLVEKADDIANIVVKTGAEGVPVYVKDLGEIVEGKGIRQGAVTADGEGEIVSGMAIMLKGENSRTVATRVAERIDEIRKSLPTGVTIEPFYDRTALVKRAIATVETNLLEGAALVIFVLLLLLGNWRGALLVATIIPLSMLFAAILMRIFDVSGNLMSLGALDFGLIVDGAVVMVENVVRRRAEAQHENSREPPERTILESCIEVARPVVFAVAIIGIVYLPILSLRGIEGKMFVPMALTVIFALLGSLILSLTYVPAMLALIMRGKVSEKESPLIRWSKLIYKPSLAFTMKFRSQVLAVAVMLVAMSGAVFTYLGGEFIPRLDEGDILIEAVMLPSVSLDQSTKTTTEIEKSLKSFPEVKIIVSKCGAPAVANDSMSLNQCDVFVMLHPIESWKSGVTKEELMEKMSKKLEAEVPAAASFGFMQPIEMRVNELIAGTRGDVAVKLFGDDLDILAKKGEEIEKALASIQGAEETKAEVTTGLPQLQVKPDRAAIARYGLNVEDVNDLVESIFAGKKAGEVFEGEQRFDIVLRLNESASQNVESVRNLVLTAPNGARVPLSQVAEISLIDSAAQISRDDTRRRIVVSTNVRGRDVATFVDEAKKKIEKDVQLPPGYYLKWGGAFENLERATGTLLIVVPIALFLIFVMLFSTFGSAKQALMIYTGIPFAIVGGVIALAVRGMPFSISAGVGFIALFGVAVLNGVVMVSFINHLREEGKSVIKAVNEGAMTRLRPVLMTALVASLGFIPMALATSAGAEVQRPLATVVIGGLITSTLLTLLILPTLYAWFEKDAEGEFTGE